jgi:hypothetical protein
MKMRRAISGFGLFALLLATIAMSSAAADSKNYTGWISDSHCGAKGASADHKSCAQTCMKDKANSWVFVDGKTKEVYKIDNQDAIDGDKDLGHQVSFTGSSASSGAIHIDSKIMAAKSSKSSKPSS